jgi:hypothetical protein
LYIILYKHKQCPIPDYKKNQTPTGTNNLGKIKIKTKKKEVTLPRIITLQKKEGG